MNIPCTLKGKIFPFQTSNPSVYKQFKYHGCKLPKGPLERQSTPTIPNIFSDFPSSTSCGFRLAAAML